MNIGEVKEPKWLADYIAHKNDETKAALKKQDEIMKRHMREFKGTVLDVATGRGNNLQRMLDEGADKRAVIVCSDIDGGVLAKTRALKNTDDSRVRYITADAKQLPMDDCSFDYVTSSCAFGNVPDCGAAAREMYRVLKPGGKLVIDGGYIEPGSKSYELAKEHGLDEGMTEESLVKRLRDAGFQNIESTIAAKAVWAENPYDLLPVAGDTQYFYVLLAEK